MEEKYNGYKNYETWTVMLIISNTESLYNFFRETIKGIKNSEEKDNWVQAAAESARYIVEEMQPDTSNTMWSQLIGHVLDSRIDFWEVGEALLDMYD